MTLEILGTILNGITGFSGHVAYRAFAVGEAPALPFICYLATDSANMFADDKVFYPIESVDVELYTARKEPDTEALVEAALNDNGLPWEKTEDFLDDQNCYEITYTISL